MYILMKVLETSEIRMIKSGIFRVSNPSNGFALFSYDINRQSILKTPKIPEYMLITGQKLVLLLKIILLDKCIYVCSFKLQVILRTNSTIMKYNTYAFQQRTEAIEQLYP